MGYRFRDLGCHQDSSLCYACVEVRRARWDRSGALGQVENGWRRLYPVLRSCHSTSLRTSSRMPAQEAAVLAQGVLHPSWNAHPVGPYLRNRIGTRSGARSRHGGSGPKRATSGAPGMYVLVPRQAPGKTSGTLTADHKALRTPKVRAAQTRQGRTRRRLSPAASRRGFGRCSS